MDDKIANMHSDDERPRQIRIFISYKREIEPDETVALRIFNALGSQFDPFIDQTMLVGEKWAKRIEEELRRSDFLISFLSSASVHSEMVLAEIEMAHKLAKERGGSPYILPVRLAYREPFDYPLNAYLNPINWAFWRGPEDTPRLIQELINAIAGGELLVKDSKDKENLVHRGEPSLLPYPLSAAQPLETPGGAVNLESGLYLERPGDLVAIEKIKQQGVTITIKGPRQIGKSSLLIRTIDAADKEGKRAVHLDFELLDDIVLESANQFFCEFCRWLTEELELNNRVEEYWASGLSNSRNCTRYMAYILKQLRKPLLLAMDEVDILFSKSYRTNFFSMIRSWHENRARDRMWKNLDLVLVTSTEPYQFITNQELSPFNVGEVIELTDFTLDQVSDLNRNHGSPLSRDEINQLFRLVGGQPYLIRKALYLVATCRISVANLFGTATEDRGPFGDHLRRHLFRIIKEEELIEGLREIIETKSCKNEIVFHRLCGAGLVRKESKAIVLRCQLYADYFPEYLNG